MRLPLETLRIWLVLITFVAFCKRSSVFVSFVAFPYCGESIYAKTRAIDLTPVAG